MSKEHELEKQLNSLSGHGTQSGTEWTSQLQTQEREQVGGENVAVSEETPGSQDLSAVHRPPSAAGSAVCRLSSVVCQPSWGPVVPAPPTPQEIVRQTWEALGLHPTTAQVRLGLRDIADLRADGFSLSEIGEGAIYAAEKGWIWSFAGVKFRLPRALDALKDHKTTRPRDHKTESPQVSGPVVPSPELRRQSAEASPHRELWDQVRERIEGRVKRQSFKTWFVPILIADYDGQRVVLEVPSLFFLEWMEEHYKALIESTFEEVIGHGVEVVFETPEGGE